MAKANENSIDELFKKYAGDSSDMGGEEMISFYSDMGI